jgi:hypothetical protein
MAIKNERAKPGSGVKHDKHAPASKADIAATEDAGENDAANDDSEVPTMDNTKAEILAYCEAHEIDVESGLTKAELIEGIAEL